MKINDTNSEPPAAQGNTLNAREMDDHGNAQTTGQDLPAQRGARSVEAALQAWLVRKLAEVLEVDESAIDVDAPLDSFGLDSLVLFSLTGDLAEWLNHDLPATLLFEVPTINELAQLLVPLVAPSECDTPVTPD